MSRMTAIELANFMSIESARLEFDDTGVINIVGYNDSGKSAITRAMEVIMYDAYSNDQIKFIQDDKEFFGVGVEFDDGVAINKYKYATGKSVWEMMQGDKVLYTNRLADGIAAMGTIPEPISAYLGVVQDAVTDEKLNVRRNTDRLFLIGTSGGDNYKILNSVLRADILAESVKRMNEDRNTLQSEVFSQATASTTLKGELKGIVVLEEQAIKEVTEQRENLTVNKQRVESLMAIDTRLQNIEDLYVHPEVELLDKDRYLAISQLIKLKEQADIPVYPEAPILEIEQLKSLRNIGELRNTLETPVPPESPLVDIEQVKAIRNVGETYNALWQQNSSYSQVEQDHVHVLSELKGLSESYGFKICKSCGTIAV